MKKIILFFTIVFLLVVVVCIILVMGGDEKVEHCNSKTELAEFLGIDFSGMEMTDIQYKNYGGGTDIYIYLNSSDEVFKSNQSIFFGELQFEDTLTPAYIQWLENNGIEANNVQACGMSYKDYIDARGTATPIEISWYQLKDSHNYAGNIIMFASVPCKVELDVEKILNEYK